VTIDSDIDFDFDFGTPGAVVGGQGRWMGTVRPGCGRGARFARHARGRRSKSMSMSMSMSLSSTTLSSPA
jgi:hypothetical protein